MQHVALVRQLDRLGVFLPVEAGHGESDQALTVTGGPGLVDETSEGRGLRGELATLCLTVHADRLVGAEHGDDVLRVELVGVLLRREVREGETVDGGLHAGGHRHELHTRPAAATTGGKTGHEEAEQHSADESAVPGRSGAVHSGQG